MSDEQLSLLDWKPSAEVLPFPVHRSHGLTVLPARRYITLKRDKQTGLLLSLRSKMMRRYSALFGEERAALIVGDLVEAILRHAEYQSENHHSQKQIEFEAVILEMKPIIESEGRHDGEAGEGSVPRAVPLVGVGKAHNETTEQDITRAREEGAA